MPPSARTARISLKTRAGLGFAALALIVERRNNVLVGVAAQLRRVRQVKSGGLPSRVREVPCRSQCIT